MQPSDHENQPPTDHSHPLDASDSSALPPSPSEGGQGWEPSSDDINDQALPQAVNESPAAMQLDSDEPVASSLEEGQSVFDAPAVPLAQAPSIPDLDQPVSDNASSQPEPAPMIASSMPSEPEPIIAQEQPVDVIAKLADTHTPQPVAAAEPLSPQAADAAGAVDPAHVTPEPMVAAAAPEPEPFFPVIAPVKPAQPTLAEKLALLKASLPAYPSPIHPPAPAPVQPAAQAPLEPAAPSSPLPLAAGFISPQAPVEAQHEAPAPISLFDAQQEISPADDSSIEESGIYATARSQATQDLQACVASPVLSLTREVENIQLEDTGPVRLPETKTLKFTGAADEPSIPFNASDEPSAPIPLVVSAVAAAGGTALALGMQGPQDQAAAPVDTKTKTKTKAKKAKKNWWFIPSSDETPQSRQGKRIDRFAAVCAVGVLGLMAVLGARVVQLQLKPDPKIAALVDSQNSKATLHYRRGVIEDRNGRALSLTRATKSVFIDPGIVKDAQAAKTFSDDVGTALKIDPAALQSKIENAGNKRFIKIVRKANEEQADALPDLLKDKTLKPLGTQTILVRDYPYKNLAAHLLGFVNIDGKGIEGVEKLFDKDLSGQNGAFTYERDSRHRSLWINDGEYKLPQDGQAVRLSIDITVQRIAEKELAASCTQFQAKSGAVIVMDPHTGEILALAVYPEIDANAFGTAAPELRKNHAITDTYEPGSTFKPFIWALATEQGYARPLEMLDCGPGFWRSSTGRRLRDSHPVGRATWEEVLVKSSNIGMAIVGERMGPQALYNAVASFGFGKPTGSGLPGEIGGIFHSLKKWTSYSVTSIPMGQEISVTPMQMARAYCALANGGTLITPTIKYVDPNSTDAQTPKGPQVLKPETAVHTRNVMRRVVLEGTGKQANSKLYTIFGKTGTAQMANPKGGGYEPDAYTGSFACGAPVDDPKIVVVTILQRPNRSIGYYGGTIAAPAGMRIVEQTLAYLGVTPDVEQTETTKPKPQSPSSRLLQVNNRAPGR